MSSSWRWTSGRGPAAEPAHQITRHPRGSAVGRLVVLRGHYQTTYGTTSPQAAGASHESARLRRACKGLACPAPDAVPENGQVTTTSRLPRVRASELVGRGWLNTGGRDVSLADLRGKVVVLDFWTFCCINCLHVLDELRELEE